MDEQRNIDTSVIYQHVLAQYSVAAVSGDSSKIADHGRNIASAFGYSEKELEGVPEDANLGLSCGNPVALASLWEGETVIDLGSGAGFDIFQASRLVGPSGRAVGVEMNPDMIARAERIKSESLATSGSTASNVSFVKSQITQISALEARTVDCIISNCVINLVPKDEKQKAFDEMFRLLKEGGRIAVSDVLARKELSEDIRTCVAAYVGCVAGASTVGEYEGHLKKAGFEEFVIKDSGADLNIWLEEGGSDGSGNAGSGCCCGGGQGNVMENLKKSLAGANLNEWVGSFKIYAVKR